LNRKLPSAAAASVETADDDESDFDLESSPQSAPRQINNKGLNSLRIGTVSMRSLELSSDRPCKSRDPDARKLFNASLMLSKLFQFFSLVLNGKHLPVEKVRDEDAHMITLRSAAPFTMNDVHVKEFFEKPAEQVSAFVIGLSKNLLQSMRYGLYGMLMNYIREKVFTPRNIFAGDEVKLNLGLTGPNAGKSFLDMQAFAYLLS
jgi:hypothetical protein